LQPYIKKIILIIYFKKIYKYEEIYSNIYIVRVDNRQIIYIRDIRFHKEDPFIRKIDKEILPEIVFNEETKRLVFKKVIFDSNNRLPLSRTPGTSQLQ